QSLGDCFLLLHPHSDETLAGASLVSVCGCSPIALPQAPQAPSFRMQSGPTALILSLSFFLLAGPLPQRANIALNVRGLSSDRMLRRDALPRRCLGLHDIVVLHARRTLQPISQ